MQDLQYYTSVLDNYEKVSITILKLPNTLEQQKLSGLKFVSFHGILSSHGMQNIFQNINLITRELIETYGISNFNR